MTSSMYRRAWQLNLIMFTKAEINTLAQKQVSAVSSNNNKTTADTSSNKQKTSTNICCNYCKEKVHVKNDCPKLTTKKAKEKGSNSTQTCSAQTPTAPWKAVAPLPGEPETKIIENTMWHWCAKCKFWCLLHGTATHSDNFTSTSHASLAESTNTDNSLIFCGFVMFNK